MSLLLHTNSLKKMINTVSQNIIDWYVMGPINYVFYFQNILPQKYLATIMTSIVLSILGGGLLLLLGVAFIAFCLLTVYIYYHRRKYAHLPQIPVPR